MMTLTEKFKRIDSALAKGQALSKASLGHLHSAVELMQVSSKESMPQNILRHVRNAEESYWHLWKEASRLQSKMDDARKTIYARPHIWESDDGKARLVMPGRLPDGEDTSTDEKDALKMYADYKAVQAVEDAKALANMEVPF